MRKTILVTGASRGIGLAIAVELASKGYDLVLVSRQSEQALIEVAKACEKLGSRCYSRLVDVGNIQEVEQLFKEIENQFGGLYGVINNAGISHIGLLADMTDEEWNTIIQTNLSSVFYTSRKAIPYMVHEKQGRIINISSIWGNIGASCEVAYSATKGGINSFTKALAKELAPSNVLVNALALGVVNTSMNTCFSEEEMKEIVDEIPMGRMAKASEVAQIVSSLLEGYTYMTGQVITVDGGYI